MRDANFACQSFSAAYALEIESVMFLNININQTPDVKAKIRVCHKDILHGNVDFKQAAGGMKKRLSQRRGGAEGGA
jgi:hypothetical protein